MVEGELGELKVWGGEGMESEMDIRHVWIQGSGNGKVREWALRN